MILIVLIEESPARVRGDEAVLGLRAIAVLPVVGLGCGSETLEIKGLSASLPVKRAATCSALLCFLQCLSYTAVRLLGIRGFVEP